MSLNRRLYAWLLGMVQYTAIFNIPNTLEKTVPLLKNMLFQQLMNDD